MADDASTSPKAEDTRIRKPRNSSSRVIAIVYVSSTTNSTTEPSFTTLSSIVTTIPASARLPEFVGG